jgi:alkyl hydroperoxide reductase subunit AhpC
MTNVFKTRQQIANELGIDVKTVKKLFDQYHIVLLHGNRVCPKDWQELYKHVAPDLLRST